ncbi:XRE family transcriptional regulator [Pseudoalteromonas sp. JC28]|uniref:helix-turn-helix domain-containing protein n=1 Tax=unclassified Pseudoalteromonas TaxID=194690 RepID=UPI001571B719|nr:MULTISPECIES: helix-turn-helix transcriptional regulator [unclassified Pseudoalteromonas]MCF2826805.1 helix-turn-helix transcriptional regulator [Pseudoalteromonas sp. OF5H-5]MCF2833638.1 helix-turn-helix transcriptional regulator [Pseudoalteromonas sp. DL2-H6]MCF2926669.1 helix-turn-helix transcriptional regulator [Pseudoalteromonas sp. DL2-H1]NSY34698.1 XRE family transcriptional regulator [Pseudoalteromonas sp. JC28]
MKQAPWAKAVQAIMKKKGIKQRDLMEVFDVRSQGAVSHYFSGRNNLSGEQIKRLTSFLGVDESVFHESEFEEDFATRLDVDALTESFQTIARIDNLSDTEIVNFFDVYEKMNPNRVAEVYEVLQKINQTKKDELSTALMSLKKAP